RNTLFGFPPDIRKAIYTTNAIRVLNGVIRAAIKKRKVFPTDDPMRKVIYHGNGGLCKAATRRVSAEG
ncbi:transposase, partial [Salmonella enterica]|nr:transposase [Salmonella enterica]